MKDHSLTQAIPDILARIVAKKREELANVRAFVEEWGRQAERRRPELRDFRQAVSTRVPAIIAEVKKASPSKGVLAADFDPARTASAYERGGAVAVSVVTDREFFQGGLTDLEAARRAVALPGRARCRCHTADCCDSHCTRDPRSSGGRGALWCGGLGGSSQPARVGRGP